MTSVRIPTYASDATNESCRRSTIKAQTFAYLPYNTEFSRHMQLYAESRLGETAERKAQCIQEMRELLRKDEKLNFRDEDSFLLKFLRSRKFDVHRAASTVKKYYSFIDSHREIFGRYDPLVVERFIRDNIVTFLPNRDNNGRAILYARAGAWDLSCMSPEDLLFASMVALCSTIEKPVNQVMGLVVILDLKNLSLKQVLALCPKYLLFAISGLQYCCPCFVSAIHVVNVTEFFRMAWNMVKPIIAEKIKKRITFHRNDGFEALHKVIPKDFLPAELDGNLGPVDNSLWAKDVDQLHSVFDEEMSYGYRNMDSDMFYNTSSVHAL